MPKRPATPIDAHVGSQVRARRTLLELSQGALGQLLGVSFQQVQKYERGTNRIGAGTLFEMARVLGVGIPFFYEGIVDDASGRPVGFAEDGQDGPSPVGIRPLDTEQVELNAAFIRIHEPEARKRALEFVKRVLEEESKKRTK